MHTVEITRAGDLAVGEQLAQMRRWLDRAGIRVIDLHAVRILRGRVSFAASFESAANAERFLQAFDDLD